MKNGNWVKCYGCGRELQGDYCHCLRCRSIAIAKVIVLHVGILFVLYIYL